MVTFGSRVSRSSQKAGLWKESLTGACFYKQAEASNGKTCICQYTLFDIIYRAVLSL